MLKLDFMSQCFQALFFFCGVRSTLIKTEGRNIYSLVGVSKWGGSPDEENWGKEKHRYLNEQAHASKIPVEAHGQKGKK